MSSSRAISIHALREESDLTVKFRDMDVGFQSTLSVRRATLGLFRGQPRRPISIHALREESDYFRIDGDDNHIISIHALREESDSDGVLIAKFGEFQSTLSVRRATHVAVIALMPLFISIHALREESDRTQCRHGANKCTFQSTLSVRRATRLLLQLPPFINISIHALREESDSGFSW